MSNRLWTDAELAAAVRAYRTLLDAQRMGRTTTKAAVRDEYLRGALSGRTKGSFEYRMANISSVLDEFGVDWVRGYRPLPHVGAKVKARLIPFLRSEGLI